MNLVIEIDEARFKDIQRIASVQLEKYHFKTVEQIIANGTPLQKGHGDLIDKEKLKKNINGWYAFMKDICKQPYMTLKQEEIIGKIDMMTPIVEADTESEEV